MNELSNELVNLLQEEDVDKEWENIRIAIKDTVIETIGIQEKAGMQIVGEL
jgi:hypothetical protein